jgi:enediyne biosynthesis protein E4
MTSLFDSRPVILAALVGAAVSNLAAAQTLTRVDVFPPPFGPTQGSSWGDYDGDGDLDVFVANGNVFAPDAQSILYRNRGDGTFDRITQGPIVEDRFAAFSSAWADFDDDRDLDLLVAGSRGTDFNVEAVSSPRIYRNEGFGQFSRIIPDAFPRNLRALTSAAVWFDIENDGDLDAYLGNDWGPNLSGAGVPNLLFRNDGHSGFTRIENDPSVEAPQQTLSVAASDFDKDGDMDLFVGNGGAGFPGYADDKLYLNDGQGGFTEVTDSDVVRSDGWTVAPAWIDFDNDGDTDLSAVNVFSPHFLFRNDGGQSWMATSTCSSEMGRWAMDRATC